MEKIRKQDIVKVISNINNGDILKGSGIVLEPLLQTDYLYVITARHCIYENTAQKKKYKREEIDSISCITEFGKKKIDVIDWDDNKKNDIAILKINKEEYLDLIQSKSIEPVKILNDCGENQDYISYGYAAVNSEEKQSLKSIYEKKNDNDASFLIKCKPTTLEKIKGFSGSPIFIKDTNYLIGIVTHYSPSLGNDTIKGIRLNILEELTTEADWDTIQVYNHDAINVSSKDDFLKGVLTFKLLSLLNHDENAVKKISIVKYELDVFKEIDDTGEMLQNIIITEYFGYDNFKEANKVSISHIEYSVLKNEENIPLDKIKNILYSFTEIYNDIKNKYGEKLVSKKLKFKILSNRTIWNKQKIETFIDNEKQLVKILDLTDLDCGAYSSLLTEYSFLHNLIKNEEHKITNQFSAFNTLNIELSKIDKYTFTESSILPIFNISYKETLFPTPLAIQLPNYYIERKQCKTIVDEIIKQTKNLFCLHAAGGMGKTVIANSIHKYFPNGSLTIIYDCYGEGTYLNSGAFRHKQENALKQIVNEISLKFGISFITNTDSTLITSFKHSLIIASTILKEANKDAILNIIIDAADNSVYAARFNGEDSFIPVLANIGALPDNCNLIFTSRTERKDELELPSETFEIPILSFSKEETKEYLKLKFPEIDDNLIKEFHQYTNQTPRIQFYALQNRDSIEGVIDFLKPHGLSMKTMIEGQLEEAKNRFVKKNEANFLLKNLISLPRPIPISFISEITNHSTGEIKDFLTDLASGIIVNNNSISFRDEDFESQLLKSYKGDIDFYKQISETFIEKADENIYVATHIGTVLYNAKLKEKLYEIVLEKKYVDIIKDPIKQREVVLERTKLALFLSSQENDNITFMKLLIIAAEESKSNTFKNELILDNLEIVIANNDIETIRKLFFQIENNIHYGAANWECAVIFSRLQELRYAKKHLGQGKYWLNRWLKLPDNKKWNYPIKNWDFANYAEAIFRIDGVLAFSKFFRKWKIKDKRNIFEIFINSIIETSSDIQLNKWIGEIKRVDVLLIIASKFIQKGKSFPLNSIGLIESVNKLSEKRIKLLKELSSKIIVICEQEIKENGYNSTIESILKRFSTNLPKYIPSFYGVSTREDDEMEFIDNTIKTQVILYHFKNEKLTPKNFYPKEFLKISKDRENNLRTDEDKNKFDKFYNYLIQVYQHRFSAVLGVKNDEYIENAGKIIKTISNDFDFTYNQRLEIGNVIILFIEKLLDAIHDIADKEKLLTELLQQGLAFRGIHQIRLIQTIANIATIYDDTHKLSYKLLSEIDTKIIESTLTSSDKIEHYQSCIRICLKMKNVAEAKSYFDKAVKIASDIDIEAFDQIKAISNLSEQLKNNLQNPKLAYELARFTEYSSKHLGDYNNFPWDSAISGIRNIDFNSALSTWCRWEHQNLELDGDSTNKYWSDNLNIALVQSYLPTETIAGLSSYYLFNYKWQDIIDQVIHQFNNEGKIKQRDVYLKQLSKDLRILCPLNNRINWLKEIIPILEKYNLKDNPSYIELKKVYDFLDKDNSTNKKEHIYEREQINISEVQSVIDETEPTSSIQINNSLQKLNENDRFSNHQKITHFFELLLKKCNATNIVLHLDALLQLDFRQVSFYDFKDIIQNALAEWSFLQTVKDWKKRNISKIVKITLLKLNKDIDEIIYFDSPSLYQFADNFNIDNKELADTLKKIMPDLIEHYSAEMIYQTFNIFRHLLNSDQNEMIIDWSLKRWNKKLNRTYAEGEWNESLNTGTNKKENFAKFLRFYLGYQDKSERWRVAHTIRRLVQLGDTEILDCLIENRNETTCSPFQHNDYTFFWISAKLWFFITLDRIADETPQSLLKHFKTIKNEALQIKNGHILIRKFAVSACLKLYEFDNKIDSKETITLLEKTLKSTLKKQNREYKQKILHDTSELNFDFDSMETIPYWYEQLGQVFNLSGNEIAQLADKYISDFFKYSGNIREDDFVAKQYYNSNNYHDIYNRKGNIPIVEKLSHYYEFHAMMMVANELLYNVPAIEDDWYEGWDYWLNRWTFSWKYEDDNKEGFWLSDLRDATPLEKKFWEMPVTTNKDEWQFAISSEYIDKVLGIYLQNDFYTLRSYYTRYNYKDSENVLISSAFVGQDSASALLNALQTAKNHYDYKLPVEGENEFIFNESRFILKASVACEDFHTENIDEYDEKNLSLIKGLCFPAKEFIEWSDVKNSKDNRFYYDDEGKLASKYENWSDYSEKLRYTPHDFGSNGNKLSINKNFLHNFLKEKKMCLILECQIRRHIENEDYQIPKDYTKLYLIYPNGTIKTLSGNIKTGKKDN